MIKHLTHEAIDKTWWDNRVNCCVNRSWYAKSDVLDIVSPNWEALVDDVSGAIMPLTWRRKFGIDYLFQPYAIQQLGVFSSGPIEPSSSTAFLDSVPQRFRYVDIWLNEHMGTLGIDGGLQNVNQTLRPISSIESLRDTHGKSARPAVEEMVSRDTRGARDRVQSTFGELSARTTAGRTGWLRPIDRRIILALIAHAIESGEASIIGLRSQGSTIAAACFIDRDGRSVLLKSASTSAGTEHCAIFHIVDNWIAKNAGTDKVLDFAGSNHAGTRRFNEGFGGSTSLYLNVRRNRLPLWLKWMKR